MLRVNSITLSGEVKLINPGDGGLLVLLTQNVGGFTQLKTDFLVFIPGSIKNQVPEINVGDWVLVQGGILYKRGSQYRIKISTPDQITLDKEDDLYLGEERAEEKFI